MNLWNFLKKVYCYVFGFRITDDMRCFINENRKCWKDFHGDAKNRYILISAMKHSADYFIAAGRTAKSIEEETGCLPIILLNAFSSSSKFWKKLYGSYGINRFLFYKNYYFKTVAIPKALFLTLNFFFRQKGIEDLLKLRYNNILLGDLIYDTILRYKKGLYTVDKVKWSYLKEVYEAFLLVIIYEKIFKKYNIKYVYPALSVFLIGGIMMRISDKYGATVILASRKMMKNYKGLNIREGKYRPRVSEVNELKNCKNIYKDIDNYFDNRFSGEVNEIDVLKSYKGKIEYTKDTLCQYLNLDRNKPIVFIMPHAFSDGPHHTPIEKLLFRDFYIWLVETLKYISGVKNVNWIIKPHPMSFKYKEEGEVARLVRKYGKNNISICPKNLNTKSIKEIADVLLTVQGKSGLEFSCFGIPAIVASQASYSGFGVAIEPKTKEEYFNLLENISSIKRLSENQIKTAKILSAIMFLYSRTSDPFFPPGEDIMYFRYNENARWKQSALVVKGYDKSNDEFYQRIKDLLKLNFYKKYFD